MLKKNQQEDGMKRNKRSISKKIAENWMLLLSAKIITTTKTQTSHHYSEKDEMERTIIKSRIPQSSNVFCMWSVSTKTTTVIYHLKVLQVFGWLYYLRCVCCVQQMKSDATSTVEPESFMLCAFFAYTLCL